MSTQPSSVNPLVLSPAQLAELKRDKAKLGIERYGDDDPITLKLDDGTELTFIAGQLRAALDSEPDQPKIPASQGLKLFRDIRDFIKRYVFLREDCLYSLLAMWVISTYLYRDFDYIGYLFIDSPEEESGKTTLIKTIRTLVWEPGPLTASQTEATIFRTACNSTQFFDEFDNCKYRDAVVAVLNAGTDRDGTVQRTEGKGEHHIETYEVFSPKVFAAVGDAKRLLQKTTWSRIFPIKMVRQTREERREKFRKKIVEPLAAPLRLRIAEWAEANQAKVVTRYETGQFPYLDQFRDRTIDITQPLAAIMETLAPGLRSELLKAICLTRSERNDYGRDLLILSALAKVDDDPIVGTATELLDEIRKLSVQCSDLPGGLEIFDVARALQTYGFETKSIRLGDGPKHRYSIDKASLNDILHRYV